MRDKLEYLNLIELEDNLIYLQENRDYVKKTVELFEKLIRDRYADERKVNLTNIEMYESLMKEINNLVKYLEESKITYDKEREILRLELKTFLEN